MIKTLIKYNHIIICILYIIIGIIYACFYIPLEQVNKSEYKKQKKYNPLYLSLFVLYLLLGLMYFIIQYYHKRIFADHISEILSNTKLKNELQQFLIPF